MYNNPSKLISQPLISQKMKKVPTYSVTPSSKKAYKAPKAKLLGNIKKLTLKSGSAIDGFGTFA
jgi:hypothetical protein